MKHEVTSLNTKKILSSSLKKFMKHKPLSKISVTEIINDCGVNRKTFYYHFEDKYALLKWTLEQETVEVLKNFDLLLNAEEALIFVLDYVDKNQHILNCAYDSMGREEMKRFFSADFCGIVKTIVESLEKEQNTALPKNFKEYLINFYAKALAGIFIDYFQDKDKFNREELIENTLYILKVSVPHIISTYNKP